MDATQEYLAGLAQLARLDSAEERRAVWRRGIASLATVTASQQLTPLEGLDPEGLLASVRVALATGLVDDLAWLSAPVGAVALYEIAAALPNGAEKRELGRRVLEALHTGGAATFVPLATSLAMTSRRALSGPAVRARIGVSLRLPIATGTAVDGLALALLCRPELEREWLGQPSTGALPGRRIAARLVERAAREAARRMHEGDDTGLKVFRRPSVRGAWDRLYNDRESLVWRHAATARGLLAGVESAFAEELERNLDPRRGPAEWRRAVTSLGASVAHDPARALARCQSLLDSPLFARDPALAAAMIIGLSRAAAQEPEAVDALLPALVQVGELDAIEALSELIWEHGAGVLGVQATQVALERLTTDTEQADDGLCALRDALVADLAPSPDDEPSLRAHVRAALAAFAEGRDLRRHVEAALTSAQRAMGQLETTDDGVSQGRRDAFRALRELDLGLLESTVLGDLVAVAGIDANASARGNILGRLDAWLLQREQPPTGGPRIEHLTFRLRRLRTLLHLVDIDGVADDPAAAEVALRRFRALLARLPAEPPSPLRATVCAALARSGEMLVRMDALDGSDLLVAALCLLRTSADLRRLGDACCLPELRDPIHAAADVARRLEAPARRGGSLVAAFDALADALPAGASARMESLRRALGGMARGIGHLAGARSLVDLKRDDTADAIDRLEQSVHAMAQIAAGVRRRLRLPGPRQPGAASAGLDRLDAVLTRVVREGEGALAHAARAADAGIRQDLPAALADVFDHLLLRLLQIPIDAGGGDTTALASRDPHLRLPAWVPPSRILGGFYVLRPVGHGTGGSVFVVRRAEERHDEGAEHYALKVPVYDGSAAQMLSEDQFMQLFREEAGALVTLPAHPNLAGFVTFDARARPKPLLVMELVQGPALERVIHKRELSVSMALAVADGIAAGLEAMHGLGVAHLDLKPANIILRTGGAAGSRLIELGAIGPPTPVLVDFGLAGRKVRPGCASPYYGAPEVWDAAAAGGAASPTAADVYSFCCLTYELLTGAPLFTADSLPALIAAHFAHDGSPPGLERLRRDRALAPVAEILAAGLAPAPDRRAAVGALRAALRGLAPSLGSQPWPVAA